ncbi:MAG: response regulator transcription factor [Chloroflexi bacterium]|nr:response regulator transcription factor [Chloroflexota bacterium]
MDKKKTTRQPDTKILLLTDKPVLAEAIKLALDHSTFSPLVVPAGILAIEAVQKWGPQIALIDMDSPGVDEFLKYLGRLPSKATRLPVVALTRLTSLQARLEPFERGVDDVITVPFAPEELLARAVAVMRRSYSTAQPLSPILRIGRLTIDVTNRSVRDGGRSVRLTSLELSLLYLLAANTGTTLTRDQIIEHLWGADFPASSNLVDRHIRNLRAKLNCNWRRPRYIATVRGHGYQFKPER